MKLCRQEEVVKNPLYDEEAVKRARNRESIEEERYQQQVQEHLQAQQEQSLKPKCPTCGSPNITKISTTSKVVGAATFGLFSKTARSQFKCNHCGYKW